MGRSGAEPGWSRQARTGGFDPRLDLDSQSPWSSQPLFRPITVQDETKGVDSDRSDGSCFRVTERGRADSSI